MTRTLSTRLWTGLRRYRRVQQDMLEEPCAENIEHLEQPIPIADKPDF